MIESGTARRWTAFVLLAIFLLVTIAGGTVRAQTPVKLGEVRLGNSIDSCRGIEVATVGEQTFAFASIHKGAVQYVVDVTDPTQPTTCTTIDPPLNDQWNDPLLANGYLFTGHRFGGLNMIDVSDPCNPQVVSTTGTNYHFKGLTFHEILGTPYLFESEHCANQRGGGLRVYDLTLGFLGWVGAALDPNWDGGDLKVTKDLFAYQLDPGRRVSGLEPVQLNVYDVAIADAPKRLGRYSLGNDVANQSSAYDLVLSADERWVLTGNGLDGLHVVDISKRNSPVVTRTFRRQGISIEGLEFLDDEKTTLIVTYRKRNGNRALAAGDVTNLPQMSQVWLGVAEAPSITDVYAHDGVLYVATRDSGIYPELEIWR